MNATAGLGENLSRRRELRSLANDHCHREGAQDLRLPRAPVRVFQARGAGRGGLIAEGTGRWASRHVVVRLAVALAHRAKDRLREVPDPQSAMVRGEVVEKVRRALEELPPAQRDVVERRLYRDQTFAAIAKEFDCPLGTVLTRMRLAVEKLRRVLEEK